MLSKITRTLAIAAAAVGLGAAVAAPAQAYFSATLNVLPTTEPDICQVTLRADFPMSQSQAQAKINAGHKIVARLWGEDPVYDDLLSGPHKLGKPGVHQYGAIFASPNGILLNMSWVMSASRLNEDNAPGNPYDELDDLYAGVRLVDKNGKTVKSMESNRYRAHFGDAFRVENRDRQPCGKK